VASVEERCAVSNQDDDGPALDAIDQTWDNDSTTRPSRARHRKALGQHFLTDSRILNRIVAAAELVPEDQVLEIGPGRGVLTRRLVQRAGRVVAVEMDRVLAAELPARLDHPPNLEVVHGDARTIDLVPLVGGDKPYKVTANLPYYAANPIVRRLLEAAPKPELLVVMVQQEVARSMLAKPGGMSILSVATQYYARPSLVCHVPPRSFRPPPSVNSSVVRLDVRSQPAVAVADESAFFQVVRAGFSAKRKQLRNSLSHGLGVHPTTVGELLEDLELDGRRRAETLTLDEWGLIYRGWEERIRGAA